MNRAHYSKKDLIAGLRRIGLMRGDVVFSHSNIGFFGLPEGKRSAKNAFDLIVGAFREVLGDSGTLVVPSFTYSFAEGEVFDPDHTPSTSGTFSEMVRCHDGSYRSEDPNVSVVALGGQAEELTRNVPTNAYGPGSFFDRFYQAGGVICNMNLDAGSTFVHYVERCMDVPYRFDKTFKGIFRKGAHDEICYSTLWVRCRSSSETIAVFEPFDKLAREKGLYQTAKVGRGFVGRITAKDMFDLIEGTLPSRPWFLIRAGITGKTPTLVQDEDSSDVE